MWVVMAVVLFNMLGMRGSKILVSLFALDLGAPQIRIGVIVALYSLIPMLLGLYAGKLTDRMGVRWPIFGGSLGIMAGLLIPGIWPTLPMLFVSAAAIGAAHIFYNVSVQNLIGMISSNEDRARNYSNFALMMSVSSFIGPLASGVSIDTLGHARTYLMLAAGPFVAAMIMLVAGNFTLHAIGKPAKKDKHAKHGFGLFANRPLRRVLIISGLLLTGIDLLQFYMPIYGHSIGMSASRIGVVMAMYAAASFVVRLWMPAIVRRLGENNVLTGALAVAAVMYLIIPWVSDVMLLCFIMFLLGLGMGCSQPLAMMLIYNRAPEGQSGEALGLRQTINHFTHMAVPLTFGAIGTALGVAPVFIINALMLAGSGYMSHKQE
jgi:MFS family permease